MLRHPTVAKFTTFHPMHPTTVGGKGELLRGIGKDLGQLF
jgi:hypothetical protein